MDLADLHDLAERLEPLQRRQRLLDGVGSEQSGRLHFAAETAQCFLVEDRREVACLVFVNNKTNRVRSDVDDGNALRWLARSTLPLANECPGSRIRSSNH